MTREDVIKLFPDATDAQITNLLNQSNSEVAREKAKAEKYKTDAQKADELQKQLDDIEQGKLTEVEQANKNLEKSNARIAELEKVLAISAQRSAWASALGGTAEQMSEIIKDDGTIDEKALGKYYSDGLTAAAQAKEQEIAKGSTNPGGGTAGGNKAGADNKTNAEKIAESLISNAPKNNDVLSHYIQQ